MGSIPELGAWNSANVRKLEPDGPYSTWIAIIDNLLPDTTIEWKCIKRLEGGTRDVIQWEPGENNVFTTPSSGRTPDQTGAF